MFVTKWSRRGSRGSGPRNGFQGPARVEEWERVAHVPDFAMRIMRIGVGTRKQREDENRESQYRKEKKTKHKLLHNACCVPDSVIGLKPQGHRCRQGSGDVG